MSILYLIQTLDVRYNTVKNNAIFSNKILPEIETIKISDYSNFFNETDGKYDKIISKKTLEIENEITEIKKFKYDFFLECKIEEGKLYLIGDHQKMEIKGIPFPFMEKRYECVGIYKIY